MSAEVQELAVRYGAAWAEHDLDAIMAMHTEDAVFHLHGGGEPAVGRVAVREAFAAGMAEVAKMAMILDARLFARLEDIGGSLGPEDGETLTPIVPSTLGTSASVVGAGLVALDMVSARYLTS